MTDPRCYVGEATTRGGVIFATKERAMLFAIRKKSPTQKK